MPWDNSWDFCHGLVRGTFVMDGLLGLCYALIPGAFCHALNPCAFGMDYYMGPWHVFIPVTFVMV